MDTTIAVNCALLVSYSQPTGSPNEMYDGNSPVASLVSQQLASNPTFELTRWELRARILADQPTESIAMHMGLPVGMVIAFESSEFNVRSSLQHSSVVLHTIINIPPTEEWSASDVGKFWMWTGFTYGAIALDLIIPPFRSLSPELQALGLRGYLLPTCDVCEEFRVFVAGKLTPIAATASTVGQRLVNDVHRACDRRVSPVDLLNSLLVLAERPQQLVADRGHVHENSRQLKESA